MAKAKAPSVTPAKHIIALIQSQAEREKAQNARLDLRKKMRDHNAALQVRADTERLRGLRGDTPEMARAAHDMGPRAQPKAFHPPRPSPPQSSQSRPMEVDLSPARRPRTRSPMASSSGPTLAQQYEGLRPPKTQRDLSRYKHGMKGLRRKTQFEDLGMAQTRT